MYNKLLFIRHKFNNCSINISEVNQFDSACVSSANLTPNNCSWKMSPHGQKSGIQREGNQAFTSHTTDHGSAYDHLISN
jgi:hypothetical protein